MTTWGERQGMSDVHHARLSRHEHQALGVVCKRIVRDLSTVTRRLDAAGAGELVRQASRALNLFDQVRCDLEMQYDLDCPGADRLVGEGWTYRVAPWSLQDTEVKGP